MHGIEYKLDTLSFKVHNQSLDIRQMSGGNDR